jgi:hypothetical protein
MTGQVGPADTAIDRVEGDPARSLRRNLRAVARPSQKGAKAPDGAKSIAYGPEKVGREISLASHVFKIIQ